VGDRALSEEILQDTMVAVWRGASTFRGDARPRSWMIAIARRQTRDRTRRRRLTNADPGLLSEWPDASPGPELQVLDRVEMTAVAAILPSLRPAHREVLGLVFGAGLTLQEAGDVLKVPVGTVKSRLSAARAALAEQLLEKGYDR
jgi:RNA polymerase sigma-70 factor (ECF subfamily)